MSSKTSLSQLKTVWSKVGLDEIPAADETRGNLDQPEPLRKKSERTAQLNLRIRPDEKERIGLLAVRDNININELLTRMLTLYEREHGKAQLVPTKAVHKK